VKTHGYTSTCDLSQTAQPYLLVNGTAVDTRENHLSQVNWRRAGHLATPWSVKHQDGWQKRLRNLSVFEVEQQADRLATAELAGGRRVVGPVGNSQRKLDHLKLHAPVERLEAGDVCEIVVPPVRPACGCPAWPLATQRDRHLPKRISRTPRRRRADD